MDARAWQIVGLVFPAHCSGSEAGYGPFLTVRPAASTDQVRALCRCFGERYRVQKVSHLSRLSNGTVITGPLDC